MISFLNLPVAIGLIVCDFANFLSYFLGFEDTNLCYDARN